MLCILYLIGAGALFGLVGHFAERALPRDASRRWIWMTTIALSVVLPASYRTRHAAVVGEGQGHASHWLQAVTAWDAWIEPLWLAASATLLAWALLHTVRVAVLARRQGRRAVVDGVPVVVTDALGPATVGALRPRVLVPRWVLALPKAERRYVLRHEDEHRRQRDALLLLVASVGVVLLPWNLPLWWQLRRLRLAIEMDCDARVVRALGRPRRYGELLLRVAVAGSRGPSLQPAFVGEAGSLERRLARLVGPRPARGVRLAAPLVALALLALVLALPHPVAP